MAHGLSRIITQFSRHSSQPAYDGHAVRFWDQTNLNMSNYLKSFVVQMLQIYGRFLCVCVCEWGRGVTLFYGFCGWFSLLQCMDAGELQTLSIALLESFPNSSDCALYCHGDI